MFNAKSRFVIRGEGGPYEVEEVAGTIAVSFCMDAMDGLFDAHTIACVVKIELRVS